MLDQNDVKTIKKVFDESLEEFAGTTLNKSFQSIENRLDTVERKVDNLEQKVSNLDVTLRTQYPNKEYLDNKLADAVSEIGLRILKRDEKEKSFKLYLIDVLKTHLHVPEDVAVKLRELAELK